MKLTLHQQKKVDEIEDVVLTYFKLEEEDILNRRRSENQIIAKAFLIYILHYHLFLSTNTLSGLYLRTPRSIYKLYAKVTDGLRYHKFYNSIYDDLMGKIKPLLPNDIERFWGEKG